MFSILVSQLFIFSFIAFIIVILYKLFPVEHNRKRKARPRKI